MSKANNEMQFASPMLPASVPYFINNSTGSVTDAALETFLGLASGALDTLVNANVTEGSAVAYTVTAQAGDKVVVSYRYQTDESGDSSYNDTAFLSVSSASFTATRLLADTFTTVSAAYRFYTYTFTQSGTFTLAVGIVDVRDLIVNSSLQIASVNLNGVALTPVYSIGSISDGGITGTAGNDVLFGDAIVKNSDDTLYGLAGDDTLFGLGGNDTLNGGDGNDSLNGGAGNDVLLGGGGVDIAQYYTAMAGVTVNLTLTVAQNTGGAGIDTLNAIENIGGGSFNDTLTGDAGNNVLIGNAGNDTLSGGDGDDSLNGGAGNDVLVGGAGVDTVQYYAATAAVKVNLTLTVAQNTGGAGIDILNAIENIGGGSFNDTLTGDAGNNLLFGNGGNDVLNGGDGGDGLAGGDGDDVLSGGNGNDNLTGGDGNDALQGGDGNDNLSGGAGNDVLVGGGGVDIAQYYAATAGVTVNLVLTVAQNTSGAGIDTLNTIENINGSNFNDSLTGNAVNNILWGGTGNDVLNGGLGQDVLLGGTGQDSFVFATALGLDNRDIITDFSVADDTIELDHAVFTQLSSVGGLAASAFKLMGAGDVEDSNDHILYNTLSGGLFYDVDGSGSSASVLVALIGKGLAVTAADFLVI